MVILVTHHFHFQKQSLAFFDPFASINHMKHIESFFLFHSLYSLFSSKASVMLHFLERATNAFRYILGSFKLQKVNAKKNIWYVNYYSTYSKDYLNTSSNVKFKVTSNISDVCLFKISSYNYHHLLFIISYTWSLS